MSGPAVIEKRKVTMTSIFAAGHDEQGRPSVQQHQAVDYVPLEILDAYVADAQTKWQDVAVGDEHDPGPGGDEGATHYPAHLDHPNANGQTIGEIPTASPEGSYVIGAPVAMPVEVEAAPVTETSAVAE